MRFLKLLGVILAVVLLFSSGCSGGLSQPVSPTDAPMSSGDSSTSDAGVSSRVLWGIWTLGVDTDGLSISVEPMRNLEMHVNITDMIMPPACYDCFEISINSFNLTTRIMDVNVTLRNQFPVTGYDVRGILHTNEYGHELKNPEDWTALWDLPSGMEINPFRAFAKEEVNRVFAPHATHTENYLVYIPQPPSYFAITFAVDASWPGNCREPYAITNFTNANIDEEIGSSGIVKVDVLDWQDNVDEVLLYAEEISGQEYNTFAFMTGDTWFLLLTNSQGVPAGKYEAVVKAGSSDDGDTYLYDVVEILISEEGVPSNPVDITPEWLNITPKDVAVDGNYAYVAGSYNGVQIYDITDPANPVWVKKVDVGGAVDLIEVSGGYAYLDVGSGFHIWQMDPTGDCIPIKEIEVYASVYEFKISGGYAYIVDSSYGLVVVDIDPPSEASIVNYVLIYSGRDIAISGDYAYVSGYMGLSVIDISSPDSPEEVHVVDISEVKNVAIEGSHAYVTNGFNLGIVDITSPESAYEVTTTELAVFSNDISVLNGYAYVVHQNEEIQVMDVDPPESPSLVGLVESPGVVSKVEASTDNIFMIDYQSAVHIIDVSTPGTANIISSIFSPGPAEKMDASESALYVAGMKYGLKVIETDFPDPDYNITVVDGEGQYARDVEYDDGYAYVPVGYVLAIVDVDPPGSSYMPYSVAIGYQPVDIDLFGDYAYITDTNTTLHIYDISDPGGVSLINTVFLAGIFVAADAEYAYTPELNELTRIIDINPPGLAYHVTTVPQGALAVATKDGYVYLTKGVDGFVVVDADPPDTVDIVQNVPLSSETVTDIAVSGDYAYVPDRYEGLKIIDINPPESAYVFQTVEIPGPASSVAIYDNHAFVGDLWGNVWVIELW